MSLREDVAFLRRKLDNHAKELREIHPKVIRASRAACLYAIDAGGVLVEAQKDHARLQRLLNRAVDAPAEWRTTWKEWVKKNCDVKIRMSEYYKLCWRGRDDVADYLNGPRPSIMGMVRFLAAKAKAADPDGKMLPKPPRKQAHKDYEEWCWQECREAFRKILGGKRHGLYRVRRFLAEHQGDLHGLLEDIVTQVQLVMPHRNRMPFNLGRRRDELGPYYRREYEEQKRAQLEGAVISDSGVAEPA